MLRNQLGISGVLALTKRLRGRPLLVTRFMKVVSQVHCGRRSWFSPALFAVLLAGCASFSPDGGMDAVNGIIAPVLRQDAVKMSGDDELTDTSVRVQRLLKSPLSAEAAIRVALVNNKALQAAYNELGVAEAVMLEASLPPNPRFSVSGISTPVELDLEARIVANILMLATLPARQEIAADRFR